MDPYARIAPFYDAVSAAFLRGPRAALAARCARLGARRILDAGCGTGLLAGMLRREAAFVVGLDASPAMLAAARAGLAAMPDRPRFILGDAAAPPFAPGSFDLVIFALTLHETASSPEDMLRAAFKLAPLVLALDWRMPERNLDYPLGAWVHLVERLAGRGHYRRFRAFMRQGGLRALAARAGAGIEDEQSLKAGSLTLALLRPMDAARR